MSAKKSWKTRNGASALPNWPGDAIRGHTHAPGGDGIGQRHAHLRLPLLIGDDRRVPVHRLRKNSRTRGSSLPLDWLAASVSLFGFAVAGLLAVRVEVAAAIIGAEEHMWH